MKGTTELYLTEDQYNRIRTGDLNQIMILISMIENSTNHKVDRVTNIVKITNGQKGIGALKKYQVDYVYISKRKSALLRILILLLYVILLTAAIISFTSCASGHTYYTIGMQRADGYTTCPAYKSNNPVKRSTWKKYKNYKFRRYE